MHAVMLRARSDLRTAWRGWIGVIVLLAIGAGATMAAGAAARRTETAYARGLRAGRAAEVIVSADATRDRPAARALIERVLHFPDVQTGAVIGGVNLGVVRNGELDERFTTGSALGFAPENRVFGSGVSRLRVFEGRVAHPDAVDEVVITTGLAAMTGWHSGRRVTDVKLFGPQDLDENGNGIPSLGTALDLKVVGVVQPPEEIIVPAAEQDLRIILTPAFARAHPDAPFYYVANLRLATGAAGVGRLRAQARKLTSPSSELFLSDSGEGIAQAQHANRPLVSGLWTLAALALVVTLLLVAQALARQFFTADADQGLLRTLGMTPGQRLSALLTETVAVAAVGVAAALALAWLLSPLAPIGAARAAEPFPGRVFDAVFFLPGALLVISAVVAAAFAPAWRQSHSMPLIGAPPTSGIEHSSMVAETLARGGLPVTVVLGARLALQPGRGRSAVPVRSILASLVVATMAATAVIAFRADLDRLATTPHLYGWNADAEAGTPFGTIPTKDVGALRGFSHLAGVSGVTLGELTIGGHDIPAAGIDRLVGDLYLTLTQGRAASDPTEIVLGAKTLRTIHAHMHDTIETTIDGRPHHLKVVGIATFPDLGQSRFHNTGLGVGASGVASLFPQGDQYGGVYNWLLFKFSTADPAADVARLRATITAIGCVEASCVVTDPRPQDIVSYASARGIPAALALLLAVLVAATVWNAVYSTTRRRRIDLDILRAMGLLPREVAAVLRWQAALLVSMALLIGVPAGLAAGHLAWLAFTHQLGVEVAAVTPLRLLAIGGAGLLAIAIAVATVTARLPRGPAQRVAALR